DSPSIDLDAFGKIGRVGYGDIEVAPDGRTLWAVNLNQRALISVDIADPMTYPGTVNQYRLANFTGVPSCTNGVLRPWGLGFYRDRAYVGCVCTGENGGTIADAEAYVLSFDPQNPTVFTVEINFDLDYSREPAVNFPDFGLFADGEWRPWANTWAATGFGNTVAAELAYPQAIVSDIDFAENGDMIIGMADRFGFQMGFQNYIPVSGTTEETSGDAAGDLLKACRVGNGWVIEGQAGCNNDNDTGTASSETNDGPGGVGEFFYRDEFNDPRYDPRDNHNETGLGSMLIVKGTGEVLATHYDPVNGNYAFDLGVVWHSPTTGARTDDFRIVSDGPVASKGNNLGDVVAACAPAPIQIGNYVWLDENGDGIQDAGEQGIACIRVELYDENGTLLAFDTTSATGQYYFSGRDRWTATWLTANDTLQPNTNYYVVVGNGQFNTTDFTLEVDGTNYDLTRDSTNSGTNRFEVDSDGSIAASTPNNAFNNLPAARITTGEIGDIDHSFDFGFKMIEYDYGDLPDTGNGSTGINNYETSEANGGPSHRIVQGLYLGDNIDAENDGFPNAEALGDDMSGMNGIDDEDGVDIPTTLNAVLGGTVRLPVSMTNLTDRMAYLEAWIDWNGDGLFTGPGEMVSNVDIGTGSFSTFLTIPIPPNALIDSKLGFRVRFSHTDNMTPNGRINSGEVEDYLIEITCPEGICRAIDGQLVKE
ncbi:MAG: SdrD B-like domain-containing protein, partial [Bacteroidota bacterium]